MAGWSALQAKLEFVALGTKARTAAALVEATALGELARERVRVLAPARLETRAEAQLGRRHPAESLGQGLGQGLGRQAPRAAEAGTGFCHHALEGQQVARRAAAFLEHPLPGL